MFVEILQNWQERLVIVAQLKIQNCNQGPQPAVISVRQKSLCCFRRGEWL